MLRRNHLGKLAFLAGLSLSFGLADFGYSDTTSPSQYSSPSQSSAPSQSNPSPVITANNGYGYQYSTYDLSAALSRDAAAKSTMTSAITGYAQAVAQARKDFRASTDYRNAAKEVADAREAYATASQPVLNKLTDNADYHSLVEGRTQLSIALSNSNLTPQVRTQLANQKLVISNRIGQMESTAMAADPSVQQAKSRVTTAERALSDLTSSFELSLNTTPGVMAAKQALDSAKTDYASAEANLNGATIARNDLMNSDLRNPPPQASPYGGYGYGGYGYGGYGYPYGVGFGFPFVGGFGFGSVTIAPGSGTSGNIVNLMHIGTGKFFPGS
jgi:hypothetical protein